MPVVPVQFLSSESKKGEFMFTRNVLRRSALSLWICVLTFCASCVDSESSTKFNLPISPTPEAISNDKELERLKLMIPSKPVVVSDKSIVVLMQKVSDGGRPEVLDTLISCLAFNFDPLNRNEVQSQSDLVPAIGIIKNSFGSNAIEKLYSRALSTNEDWLVERLALAVRTIASEREMEVHKSTQLLEVSNVKVRTFLKLLEEKNLTIKLASSKQDAVDVADKLKGKTL
jgi:hypothetical protein